MLRPYNNGLTKKTVSLLIVLQWDRGILIFLCPFIDDRPFYEDQIVIDLIYNQTPLPTKSFLLAHSSVLIIGLSMLIWQLAISFSWWTGISVDDCYEHMSQSGSSITTKLSIKITKDILKYEYSR